jgi:parallel beta-helix repeat protein
MRVWSLRALASAFGLAVVAATAVAATPAVASTGASCSGIALTVADAPDLSQVVAGYPAGTTFCLGAGEYSLTSTIKPAAGDIFVGSGSGAGGTELRGDTVLTGWTLSDGLYTHADAAANPVLFGKCASGSACKYSDSVFWNGAFLRRVVSPCTTANVVSGTYCIDYAKRIIYLFDDPAGNVVSQATLAEAFSPGTDVQLSDFAVSHFAAPAQGGAVTIGGGSVATDLSVSYSHGSGIKMTGTSPTVTGSLLFDNGQEGANGSSTDGLFQDNQVYDNNQLDFDTHWDAGGAKFAHTVDLTVSGNHFFDNTGNGLWFDVDNTGPIVTDNQSNDNAELDGGGGDGIRLEVSCNAVITGNELIDNGRHGISIANSHSITFGESGAGNTVEGNAASAIWVVANGRVERPRPLCHPSGGVYPETNDVIQDNTIQIPAGLLVGFAISNGAPTKGSAFVGNTYTAASGCAAKQWRSIAGVKVAFANWQTAGEDPAALGTCS